MKILKLISNILYKRETYFGFRCSGFGCYPSKDIYKGKGIIYKILVSGKKCGGCSDCKNNK